MGETDLVGDTGSDRPAAPHRIVETRVPSWRRVHRENSDWLYSMYDIVRRMLNEIAMRDWRGTENLPSSGPALICVNHLNFFDAMFIAEYIIYNGRWPHFLIRSDMFKVPFLGRMLRAAGEIPVYRDSRSGGAVAAAARWLDEGRLVAMYPEGNQTKDPQEWPMAPRTGAARIALATGIPITPIGQWGASDLAQGHVPHRKEKWFGKKWVRIKCGPPLDLSQFGNDPDDRAAVRAASCAISDAITDIVSELRGKPAPEGRWHPKLKQRVPRQEAVQ